MSDANEMEPLKNKQSSERSSSSGVSSERNSLKDVMMTNRDEVDDLRPSDKEKAQLIEPNCEAVVRDNLAPASPAFGFGSIASLAQGQPGDHNPIECVLFYFCFQIKVCFFFNILVFLSHLKLLNYLSRKYLSCKQ